MADVNPGRHGLKAWWSLNEAAASSSWLDEHINAQTLTAVGTLGSESAKQGNGAVFEAANGEYLTRATTLLSSGGTAFTLTGWIKPTALALSDFRYVFSFGSLTNNRLEYGVRINHVNDRLEFVTSSDGTVSGANIITHTTTLVANTWYFYAIIFNPAAAGAQKKIVVDSTVVTAAYTSGVYNGGQNIYVGFLHNVAGTHWDGSQDIINFWSRALSNDELSWLRNGGNGRQYSETIFSKAGRGRAIAQSAGLGNVIRQDSGRARFAFAGQGAANILRPKTLTLPSRSFDLTLAERDFDLTVAARN